MTLSLLASALLASGCGDVGARTSTTTAGATAVTPKRLRAPAPTSAPTLAPTCALPAAIMPAPLSPTGLAAAHRALLAATGRATRLPDRRFVTRLSLTLDSGLVARATLRGSRLRDGSSTALLRWQGPARLLLPDTHIRIRGNQLATRPAATATAVGPAWTQLGSASGIALDVGRELFTHDFLLDVTGAATRATTRTVRAVARPAELRAYATTERQGLATELLAGATSLRIDARIDRGLLTADVFRLRTRLPQPWRTRLGSAGVTLVGQTVACPAAR